MAKITKRAVDGMAPGSILWDDAVSGFGVRRRDGAPYYFVKYRLGKGREARQRWITIGRHGSPWTVDAARRKALKILGRVADREDPAARRDFEGELPRLGGFADGKWTGFAAMYLEQHSRPHKAPGSVKEDERNLRLHILPALGTIRVDALTTADMARFHSGRDHRPANANRCVSLLSHMMRMAEAWGMRPKFSNPCREVVRYAEEPRERFLSAVELARFGDAIAKLEKSEEFSPYALAALRMLALTGARKSEIVTLRWDHVNLARGIARRDTKTGIRNIHLPPPACAILKALPRVEGSPWVFPGTRDTSKPLGDLEGAWRRVRKDAELEPDAQGRPVRLHDLRHSFASVAIAGGDSLPLIGAMLGHTNAATTQRYAHLSADPVAAAAAATAKRIAAAMRRRKSR